MQNRKHLRVLICLMALLLVLGMFPCKAAATEETETYPIFELAFDMESGTTYFSAFCVRDYSTGNTYLITAAEAAEYADEANKISLLGVEFEEVATYLETIGQIAYFWAPELDQLTPYELGRGLPETVIVTCIHTEEETRYLAISNPVDLTVGWINRGSYLLSETGMEETTERVGAAVLTEDGSYVVGMVSRNEDNSLAILSLEGTVFEEANAVVDAEGNATKPNSGKSGNDEPEKKLSLGAIAGIVAVAVLAVAAALSFGKKGSNKKNATPESKTPEVSSATPEHTVPMVNNEMASDLVGFTTPASGSKGVQWQLRCVRGPMEGKTYPLNGRLTIGRMGGSDIHFPEGTQGVSGRHCQVSLSGGKVVLQDLNATYGTYFGMDLKARLKPNMEYPLNAGDVFVLAEGGPAFRLERLGGAEKKATFAIRNGSGNVFRPNAEGEITFGRGAGNVVVFDQSNSSVSGKHCRLFMKEDGLYLVDMGSTNGTFFNENQRLKPNVAYKVSKGAAFFLVDSRNTFLIIEE